MREIEPLYKMVDFAAFTVNEPLYLPAARSLLLRWRRRRRRGSGAAGRRRHWRPRGWLGRLGRRLRFRLGLGLGFGCSLRRILVLALVSIVVVRLTVAPVEDDVSDALASRSHMRHSMDQAWVVQVAELRGQLADLRQRLSLAVLQAVVRGDLLRRTLAGEHTAQPRPGPGRVAAFDAIKDCR